jgi:hypothetical protein
MVQCLVKDLGANINLAMKNGSTPLIVATITKHEMIVRYLLKNGANAQARLTNRGFSASTAAELSKDFGAPAELTAYIEARMHCANPSCFGAGLKKCAKCLEVFFCSKECQVATWPAHKADCKRRAEEKASRPTKT